MLLCKIKLSSCTAKTNKTMEIKKIKIKIKASIYMQSTKNTIKTWVKVKEQEKIHNTKSEKKKWNSCISIRKSRLQRKAHLWGQIGLFIIAKG